MMDYAVQVRRSNGARVRQDPGSPISEPALLLICKSATGVRERLGDVLMRIEGAVSRAAGLEPAQGETQARDIPPSNGFLDDLRLELARIDDLVRALADQASRLEQIA